MLPATAYRGVCWGPEHELLRPPASPGADTGPDYGPQTRRLRPALTGQEGLTQELARSLGNPLAARTLFGAVTARDLRRAHPLAVSTLFAAITSVRAESWA